MSAMADTLRRGPQSVDRVEYLSFSLNATRRLAEANATQRYPPRSSTFFSNWADQTGTDVIAFARRACTPRNITATSRCSKHCVGSAGGLIPPISVRALFWVCERTTEVARIAV